MSTVYSSQITQATRLIDAKGQTVTWRQLVDGASATPWKPSAAVPTDTEVTMAFFPEDLQGFRVQQYRKDDSVPTGLEVAYMAQQSFTPKIKDTVIRDGKEMNVWYVDTLAPDGTDILYTVGLET